MAKIMRPVRKFSGILRAQLSSDWAKVGMVFIGWRLIVSGLFALSVIRVHQIANPGFNPPVNATLPLQGTVKWDGYHYLYLVANGWSHTKNAFFAFYPLFPLLVRWTGKLLHIGPVPAAVLINFIASYFACYFLYKLARDFFTDRSHALRAMLLFMFFPMAYFLFAFYTEAVFCALGFGAFYFARKRLWAASCFLLALVSAVRLPGLMFVLAVFVEYLSSKQWSIKKIDKNILWFLISPLGFLSYMFFSWKVVGDPFMFKNAYNYGWGYQKLNLNFIHTIFGAAHGALMGFVHRSPGSLEGAVNIGYEAFSWFAVLALVISRWQRLPISYIVLCLSSLILYILNSNTVSVNRYVFTLFPIYLVMYSWVKNRPTAYGLLLGCSAATMGLYLTMFSNGFWTG
jgi:hypothetical protein